MNANCAQKHVHDGVIQYGLVINISNSFVIVNKDPFLYSLRLNTEKKE